MRIAWTGDAGSDEGGGVAGIAFQMIAGLVERGHDVTLFAPVSEDGVHASLRALQPRLSLVEHRGWWRWERWYSRDRLAAFVSSSLARAQEQRTIGRLVLAAHAHEPFDVIFQMSQLENFFPAEARGDLPLVVHPCTIAATEAEWHRREWRISWATEGARRWAPAQLALWIRGLLQGRHARDADLLIGPSMRFAELLSARYAVPRERIAVLRHPVRLDRFRPAKERADRDVVEVLFISRLSSRKGLDLLVDLSHRLEDLEGVVRIRVIGGMTLWSDYSKLVVGLNPKVATYAGLVQPGDLAVMMRDSDVLVVPSRFEPGSIVSGEALASGLAVVASDEVGPSELLAGAAGRSFPDGDMSAFERAVRHVVADVMADRAAIALAAREVAERHLATEVVVDQLERQLLRVTGVDDR